MNPGIADASSYMRWPAASTPVRSASARTRERKTTTTIEASVKLFASVSDTSTPGPALPGQTVSCTQDAVIRPGQIALSAARNRDVAGCKFTRSLDLRITQRVARLRAGVEDLIGQAFHALARQPLG